MNFSASSRVKYRLSANCFGRSNGVSVAMTRRHEEVVGGELRDYGLSIENYIHLINHQEFTDCWDAGAAAYDLLYFFVNSLTVADQDEHLVQLIREYQARLAQRISDYSLDDLKRDLGYCSLTFRGCGNGINSSYFKLTDYLNSPRLLRQFLASK
jgi:DNA-binding transcriptional MerR regulator